MLCGYFPFYSENERELYKQIRSARYDFPEEEWSHVSDAAKDLVSSMLTLDPRLRATSTDCLRHPWIARPGVPSRIPFPQKSLDRLRNFVESENNRKLTWKHPADQALSHHNGNVHGDRFRNAVHKIIASNRCLSSGNSVDHECNGYYRDRFQRHNTIHPARDMGNDRTQNSGGEQQFENDFIDYNGPNGMTQYRDDIRSFENYYARYEQGERLDRPHMMKNSVSSEAYEIRRPRGAGKCGCLIQ